MEKARQFQKNIYFCYLDYTKAFDCVDHNKLWKIFQEFGIREIWVICMQVKKQQLELDTEQQTVSKSGKEYCVLSPYLFILYAEYIMQNTRLDESQAGSKIAGRNINNLKYAADTTLMAENEGN